MKMQIRRGVFETNSSSVHSITMCTGSDFDRWTDGELLFWEDEKKFGTREEIIEDLKKSTWYDGKLRYPDINWDDKDQVSDIFNDENIKTFNQYFQNDWFETYWEAYTTPGGENVVAFGYYGHD